MNQTKMKEAWHLIFRIGETMRNIHQRNTLKPDLPEVTISQLRVLSCIVFSDDKTLRLKDIADELGITPGGVSQLVETLVKVGALERTVDKDDRRAVNITLSKYGREAMLETDVYFSELSQRLLSSVPPEKQKVFLDVLETMMGNLNKMKKQP